MSAEGRYVAASMFSSLGLVLERLSGDACLHWVELWIELQGAVQILTRALNIAARLSDHPGVIKKPGIPGAEPERLVDCGLCFVESACLQSRPRQRVCAVYVSADLVLPFCSFVSFLWLEVVIGVEQRNLPVVEHAIKIGQTPDLLDQLILSGSIVFASRHLI